MPREDYICVTFLNVHAALQFERKLKQICSSLRLIPVPRRISATCGMAAKLTIDDWGSIQEQISSFELEFEKIYLIQDEQITEII